MKKNNEEYHDEGLYEPLSEGDSVIAEVDKEDPEVVSYESPLDQFSHPATDGINDDDIRVIKNNDKEVESSDDYAVFEQEEGMISWSIQNFYNEDGEIRSKRELQVDPAILRVEDSNGSGADFLLTQEFSKSLNDLLEKVYLATYGIQKSKKSFDSFKDSFKNSIIANPIKSVLLGLIIVMIPLFLFVF